MATGVPAPAAITTVPEPAIVMLQPRLVTVIVGVGFRTDVEPRTDQMGPRANRAVDQSAGYGAARVTGDHTLAPAKVDQRIVIISPQSRGLQGK